MPRVAYCQGSIGHYMIVKSFHSAETSMRAPFTYSQLVGAILWGLLLFNGVAGFIAGKSSL